MASERDGRKPDLPKAKSDFVYYLNPDKGLRVLPVVGALSPGWNKVPRGVHEATMRDDGTCVIPREQAVPIRDEALVTAGASEKEAIGIALDINKVELIDETLVDERRPQVRRALEHQRKVIKLEEQPSEELKRLASEETRPDVASAIAKAAEAKKA